jgi:hypothetical protein
MILYNGDGIGNAEKFNVGAKGAGLGYTHNRRDADATPENNTLVVPGVEYGYLGLGLDEFGNYKNVRNDGSEYREGVSNDAPGWANGSSHIVLRGPGNPDTTFGKFGSSSANAVGHNKIFPWHSGYPVLYTAQTTNTGAPNRNYSASLNPETGAYTYSTTPVVSVDRSFTLGTKSPVWDPQDPDYRKVFLDIVPVPLLGASQSKFLIYVTIQHGQLKDTVINGYELPNGDIKAVDNGTSHTFPADADSATRTISAKLPDFLNIAFAASTGARTNYHYIRNLYIVTPYSAGVTPHTQYICRNDAASVYTISDIFTNDSAYTGEFTGNFTPIASKANIDSTSFVFSTAPTSVPDTLNVITTDGVTAKTEEGVWAFNYISKEVTFTPDPGNTSKEGKIYYSIKGKSAPFNGEAYRSVGAVINVVASDMLITEITTKQNGENSINAYLNEGNNIRANQPFSFQLQPAGDEDAELIYTAANLPESLSISSTGEIYGTTPAQGRHEFTVTLTNATECSHSVNYVLATNAPLPVTYLVPVKAAIVNNAVRLDWQTATETNNKHFAVQRSADRTAWQSIGTVNSFFAAGTGSGHAYSYTDENPLQGNNFYRLQQVDISGNAELSDIVNISFNGNSGMYISPNPAKGNIKIHNLPEDASVQFTGVNGRTYKLPVNNGNIDVEQLSAGVYFVRVSVSNSVVAKLKFVKE